uniref:Coiled-coil domain containing 134 n=1 Tax=Vombatus ursinus TaxID=29139 RepID=A0A4X2JQM5_VOMUR
MDLSQLCAFCLMLLLANSGASDPSRPDPDRNLEIYKKLFAVKRKDQMKALKNLVELNDIHQQYKIIDVMLKGLFKSFQGTDPFQKALKEEERRRRKEEKRKEIRKGPRISRSQSEL